MCRHIPTGIFKGIEVKCVEAIANTNSSIFPRKTSTFLIKFSSSCINVLQNWAKLQLQLSENHLQNALKANLLSGILSRLSWNHFRSHSAHTLTPFLMVQCTLMCCCSHQALLSFIQQNLENFEGCFFGLWSLMDFAYLTEKQWGFLSMITLRKSEIFQLIQHFWFSSEREAWL